MHFTVSGLSSVRAQCNLLGDNLYRLPEAQDAHLQHCHLVNRYMALETMHPAGLFKLWDLCDMALTCGRGVVQQARPIVLAI